VRYDLRHASWIGLKCELCGTDDFANQGIDHVVLDALLRHFTGEVIRIIVRRIISDLAADAKRLVQQIGEQCHCVLFADRRQCFHRIGQKVFIHVLAK
jgi:hypothetical protein